MPFPLQQLLDSGETLTKNETSHCLLRRDGTTVSVSWVASLIHDEHKKVSGAVLIMHDTSREKEMIERLGWLAQRDPLTSLYNRRAFEEHVGKALDSLREHDVERRDNAGHVLIFIDLDQFKAAIRPDTILASVLFVNNEIGVIQDIAAIGAICREKGVLLHVDAAQATGRVEIDLKTLPVDLMSLTAHKTYGPKGVGALYVRRKPRVRLEAQMHGGGHERGMRSGTLPTHQIVGMGEAYRIAKAQMQEDNAHAARLQKRLLDGLKEIEQVFINGSLERRVPQNLNMSFNYVEGESLIMGIKGLAVSSGSACTSASLEPSYVLRALGRSDELAHSSLRMTIGRFTTEEEIDYAIQTIRENVAKLRELSPLWEMHQEGIDLSTIQWAAH